ncbi:MAG: translation initiation factor [Mariprofundales bacterium]|nr:translation initiation factor [Mariprofundales bacterium]
MRDRKLVYSTEHGLPPRTKTKPQPPIATVPGGGVLVRREKKGRGGKEVTVVLGINAKVHDLKALSRQIKSTLGTGGAVKNGTIEIQGNHCEQVITLLADRGIASRRGGG